MAANQNMPEASAVSFEVNVHRLPRKGMPVRIQADEKAREALAKAHDLLSVERFEADLMVAPWKREGIRVSGKVRTRITQACIVTLEPITQSAEEELSATFVPEGSRLARDEVEGGEFILDAEGPDLPETFHGDRIDVGALAEEFFALGINPYPRKAGVNHEADPVVEEADERVGPLYEKLKKLQQKS